MKIRKAVITAAGRTSALCRCKRWWTATAKPNPPSPSSSRKCCSAGIEEICVVICPGDQGAFAAAAGPHGKRVQFVEQPAPLGYGHAVDCAREFTGANPFCCWSAIIFMSAGTTILRPATGGNCGRRSLRRFRRAGHARKQAALLRRGGRAAAGGPARLYQVDRVLEKPTPTVAEQRSSCPACAPAIIFVSSACTC